MFRPIRHTVTKESVAVGWAMCHSLQFRQKGPPSGLLCNWMGALCKHVLMRSRRMCSLRNSSVDLGFCITTFLPFSHEYINLLFWSHSSLGMLFLGFISNFWINITFKKEKKTNKDRSTSIWMLLLLCRRDSLSSIFLHWDHVCLWRVRNNLIVMICCCWNDALDVTFNNHGAM